MIADKGVADEAWSVGLGICQLYDAGNWWRGNSGMMGEGDDGVARWALFVLQRELIVMWGSMTVEQLLFLFKQHGHM